MTHEELNNIAWEHYLHGRFAGAQATAEEALALSRVEHNKEQEAKSLNTLGNVAYSTGNYQTAEVYYREVLELYENLGDKSGAARVAGNIGNVHSNMGSYSLALEYYDKALAVHEENGNKALAARVTGNIGLVYDNMGSYALALEYMGKALAAHEKLGNKASAASVTGNIGNIHHSMGSYALALEYFKKAIASHEELGDKVGAAIVTGNIGLVHYNMGSYTLALEYYGKALASHEELGDKAGIARVTGNIGGVHLSMGSYALALEYYQKALATDEELGNKTSSANVTGNIGSLYADKKFAGYEAAKAEEMLLKALAINEEIGAKKQLYEIHKKLSELCEQQERWQEAHEHFKKYHEVFQEVQSEKATKEAQLIEHRRKVEEAERDRQIKLARFQEQEKILHKTLPPVIADRLISGEKDIADRYESVSILFADIVGFTPLSTRKTPREVVHILNNLFSRFDALTKKYGVERIKTIGDAYMIVSGAPEVVEDHAFRLAQTAFGMLEEIAAFNTESGESINLRIGLNSGEAIAAVVGDVKFTYDLWSDAVNTASRMESHGVPGKIHCTEEFMKAVGDSSFHFTERGEMDIKGKGLMKTYFLETV